MAESSLAVVKVEELLKEVRVDYDGRTRVVESAIKAVRRALLSLPDQAVTSSLAAATIEDLGVPAEKAAFRFLKPESVVVVGSYAERTVTKPAQNVDLAVRIPKACFHEKDFLNHRYHAKRTLYLAHVEREILKCPAIASTEWSSFNHEARKPILVLHPAPDETGASTKFCLRLLPTIAIDVFDGPKLGLSRNNVRASITSEGLPQPTPLYNSGIVEDMHIEHMSAWLQTELSNSSNIRDAICLAKVWLRQRSMQGHGDGMGGFLASLLVIHLQTPSGRSRISEYMTSLQVFRVLLDAIGNADILGKGIFLQSGDSKLLTSEAKQLMKATFDVLVCDPSGLLNLACHMTKSALDELKEDALRTLEAMKRVKDGGFDVVFMTPLDFAARFDYHVRLDVSAAPSTGPCSLDDESWRIYEKRVETLLCKSLRDRACLVRVIRRGLPAGWMPRNGLKVVGTAPLYAGVVLNNISTSLRMADIGPDAGNKEEAKNFRAFWGERSELRRFKDGKISETAVWEIQPWKRHLIIEQIVNHVLHRHLSLSSSAIKVTAGQLDFALLVRDKDQISIMPELLEAFEALSKKLRSIDNLPLKVVSVHPLSAVFRHAAVYYPQFNSLADERSAQVSPKILGQCVDPLEVALQLEGSGRWPADAMAIQKTKTAFCLQIAGSMQQRWGTSCVAAEDAVDILTQGFAFRLNILYEKDPTHLSKERIASSLVTGKLIPSKIVSGASKLGSETFALKADLLLRSMHASMLYGLHGLYPVYSPTVRLAKRWVAAHLLYGALPEEAVELLVAHVFVSPAPYGSPTSRITGFLRFLQLVSQHDWSLAPLIVDVNGDITPKDEELIQAQFDKLRQHSPTLQGKSVQEQHEQVPMYIATAYDMGSETWTRSSPTARALKRLVSYARSSATLLGRLMRGEGDSSGWQTIFRTPLDSYDIVVLLHKESLPHPSRVLFPGIVHTKSIVTMDSPKQALSLFPEIALGGGLRTARDHLLIGFDSVLSFVEELRCRFGESCNIWYDTTGSDALGLVITKPLCENPEVPKAKRIRKANGHFRKANGSSVEILVTAIQDLGVGLVRSIHVPDKPNNK